MAVITLLADLHLVGHVVAAVGDLFEGYELITVNAVVWRSNPTFVLRVLRTLQLVAALQAQEQDTQEHGHPIVRWAPSAGERLGRRE